MHDHKKDVSWYLSMSLMDGEYNSLDLGSLQRVVGVNVPLLTAVLSAELAVGNAFEVYRWIQMRLTHAIIIEPS